MRNAILPVDGQLDACKFTNDIEEEYNYKLYSDNPAFDIDARNKKFYKCKFSHIDFSKVNVEGASFNCCIFENCALQNIDLSKNGIYNTIFEKCKFVGIKVINSTLKGVTFDNVVGIYNDFSGSKLLNVHIIDSQFTKSSFNNITTKDVIFSNADITGSEFNNAGLQEVDFSNCDIHDIQIDLKSLKGLIVNREQALAISSFLGIYIKEDLEDTTK